jgi:hypothetical protein
MGDRRNVIVTASDTAEAQVALYTHWSGSELPQTVASALDRARDRWDDPTYLTRVIFSEMIKAESSDDVIEALMSTTGLGIEAILPGSENYCEASPGYDLYVDVKAQTVYDGDETTYSFERFVEAYRA